MDPERVERLVTMIAEDRLLRGNWTHGEDRDMTKFNETEDDSDTGEIPNLDLPEQICMKCSKALVDTVVCCSEGVWPGPQGSGDIYEDATCVDCCGPHPKIHDGIGGQEIIDG